MDPALIAALLSPFLRAKLSASQLDEVNAHLKLLLHWNQKINLTSLRSDSQILARHFGESLFAAQELLTHNTAIRVCDLGSGAGFPGIPLKIFAHKIHVTLIESQSKKATFLREVVRTLGWKDAAVHADRAETLPAASADLVTLRAVEKFEDALPIAARLLKPGAFLGLLIGGSQADAARAALPGFTWYTPMLIPQSQQRVLLTGQNQ